MIQCKRVYDPQESSDGYRVLVDRLWPRGIKKEALACDEWCKELTPSAELRKAFHGEAIDFAHFSQRYRQELDAHRETGLRLAAGATPAADAAVRCEEHRAESCPGVGRLAGGPAGYDLAG
ncbi:hypothetical protein GQ627_001201 [Klebsiella pneumoniae]|nr:hypothetical protein GQ627_001201 [Klebsiella pneumoniae]